MNEDKMFGRLLYGKLVYAPLDLVGENEENVVDAESAYLEHGYKKVVLEEQPPSIPRKIQKAFFEETEDSIYRKFRYVDIEPDYTTKYLESYRATFGQFEQINNALYHIGVYERSLVSDWLRKDKGFRLLYTSLICKYPGYTISQLSELFFDKHGTIFTYNHDKNGLLSDPPISDYLSHKGITGFELMQTLMTIYVLNFRYEQTQYRMIFSYLHTVFDDFLSKVIRLIVSLYPLGASLKISFSAEELFGCNDIDELRSKVIDSKIDALGYDNYQAKMEFITAHGVKPSLDRTEYWDDIILFCEQRNILVHNAGIVNNRFIEKCSATRHKGEYTLGQRIEFDRVMVSDALSKVSALCSGLNDALKEKFRF